MVKMHSDGRVSMTKKEFDRMKDKVKKMSDKGKKFMKGGPSKTKKNELDFTTKKSSTMFNRGGKRQDTAQGSTRVRRPY